MDYAPGSAVAEDYMHLAVSAAQLSWPAVEEHPGVRWSER